MKWLKTLVLLSLPSFALSSGIYNPSSGNGGGGGGGTSSLAVNQNGVQISSPTGALNFVGPPFIVTSVGGTTAQITLDPSSVTLQGNNLSATYLTNSSATATYLQLSSATATYLQQSSATVSYCHADGSNCTSSGSTVLASSGIAFGSPTNTITSDTNTFTWNNSTKKITITGTELVSGDITSQTSLSAPFVNIGFSGEFLSNNGGFSNRTTCVGETTCGINSTGLTGTDDAFVGFGSGGIATSAGTSTGFGSHSLFNLTTGNDNSAFGANAGQNLSDGSRNMILGKSAGLSISHGSDNTVLGYVAGQSLTTGVNNTLIGSGVGELSTASSNTIIGAQTGVGNAGDQGNIFIGYGSGNQGTNPLTNSIAIGFRTIATSSNTVILGSNTITTTILQGAVQVTSETISNLSSFNGNINISSGVLLSGSAGSNGQLLTSGGSGTVPTWTTVTGGSGSGIVSPGTFTWVNNFGVQLSTLVLINSTSSNTLTVSTASTGVFQLSVSSTVSVLPTDFLLSISSSSGTMAFGFQNSGHLVSSGTTPSMGTCGGSPAIVGTDLAGVITVGSGVVTSCVMNFANAFTNVPVCLESSNSTSVTADISSISTTSVTFGFSATLGGGTVWYVCIGNKG